MRSYQEIKTNIEEGYQNRELTPEEYWDYLERLSESRFEKQLEDEDE